MEKFLHAIIGLLLGAIIAFVLSMAPGFVKSAFACGGWWDPCCPWWEPQRCEAYNANKKKIAEENVGYFQRWEDRLENVNRGLGLVPGGNYASWLVNQAKDAAKKAREANEAVAKRLGGEPVTEYAVTPYEWPNQLGEDAAAIGVYGFYSGGQAAQYTGCMQDGGEGSCQPYKDAANDGLWYFGEHHREMGNTLDVLGYQMEYWYPEMDEAAVILREMRNMSWNVGWGYQQQ